MPLVTATYETVFENLLGVPKARAVLTVEGDAADDRCSFVIPPRVTQSNSDSLGASITVVGPITTFTYQAEPASTDCDGVDAFGALMTFEVAGLLAIPYLPNVKVFKDTYTLEVGITSDGRNWVIRS
jgi:hypothetical protein